MSLLTEDDLALAMEIKQKISVGINVEKEKIELAEKVNIANRIGDQMVGLPLDAELVMIEMTALIVAITVGINSPQAKDQAMLTTGLILQRIRDTSPFPEPKANMH